jgi:hypothetical protein
MKPKPIFAFCIVLMASAGAHADTSFFSSSQRSTGLNCTNPPLDTSIQPATTSPAIPPGSRVTGVTFNAPNFCGTSCGPYQYRIDRIWISHNGLTRGVPNGTWHDFDGQDASGTWSTGLEAAQWGCPSSFGWNFTVTYTPPPPPPATPTQVIPSSGSFAGGTAVTIKGRNFPIPSSVWFNIGSEGHFATSVRYVDSETLTAVTPAMAATGPAGVTVDGGDTVFNLYTFLPPPTVTAVTPSSGFPAGGIRATITGTNFAPGAEVFVDGYAATDVTFLNGTTLIVTMPAHAPGSVRVTVFVGPFGGTRENAFTYYVPMHWSFLGTNGHVYNLFSTDSGYAVHDATAAAGAPPAAPGSPLSAFVDGGGGQHWSFLDSNGHVYNLYWNSSTGYGVQDATAATGAPPAAAGSPLSAFADAGGGQHWSFFDSNGDVYNLYWNSSTGYGVQDATAAIGAPPAAAGSALSAFADVGGGQHWSFLDSNGDVYNLYWNSSTGYGVQDATAATGAPPAAAGSALSAFADPWGGQHWSFLDSNGHVYNLSWTSAGGYTVQDVTTAAGAPAAAPGSPLSGFADL